MLLQASAWCFAVLLVFVFPLLDWRLMQRLRRNSTSRLRLLFYRAGTASEWLFAGAAAWLLLASGNSLLGTVRSTWLLAHPGVQLTCLGFTGGYAIATLIPGVVCLTSPKSRVKYTRAMRRVVWMLPVSGQERRWFALLSVTAGLCEELLYRGFLLRWLAGHVAHGPHLAVWAAWLISSLAFGTAHLYQGRTGVLSTTLAGCSLAVLFWSRAACRWRS